jgi:hypothetical protein
MVITELSEAQCNEFLSASRVGRLACARDGQPYVVPVTFAFAQHALYSFSLPGQKIEWMRENPKVCVQVDESGERGAWKSVVVFGRYAELPDRIGSKLEREHAWSLLSRHASWWEPGGLKPVATSVPSHHLFYKISVESLSGRQAQPE